MDAAPDQQWAGSQPGPQAEYAQAGQTPVGGFPDQAGVGGTPMGIPDQQVGAVQAATAQAEAQANELARLSDANGVFEKTLNTIDGELANRMRQPKQWAMIPEEKRQKIIEKTKRVLQKVIADIDKRLAERRAKKQAMGLDPNIPTAEQQGGGAAAPGMMQPAGIPMEQGVATAMPPTMAAPGGTPMAQGQVTGFAESNAMQSNMQGMQMQQSQAGAPAFDAAQGFQPPPAGTPTGADNVIITKLQNQTELVGNVDYEGFKGLFVNELGQLDHPQLETFFNQYAVNDYLNLDELQAGTLQPQAAPGGAPGVGFDGQSGVMSEQAGDPMGDPNAMGMEPGPDGAPPPDGGDMAMGMDGAPPPDGAEPGLEAPGTNVGGAEDGAEPMGDGAEAPADGSAMGTADDLDDDGMGMAGDGAEVMGAEVGAEPEEMEAEAGDNMPGDEDLDPDEMAMEEDGAVGDAGGWDMAEDGAEAATPATGIAEEAPEDLDNEAQDEADE